MPDPPSTFEGLRHQQCQRNNRSWRDCFHNSRANQRKQISRGCPTGQQGFAGAVEAWAPGHLELFMTKVGEGTRVDLLFKCWSPTSDILYSLVVQVVIRFWSGAVGQQAWGHLELFMTVYLCRRSLGGRSPPLESCPRSGPPGCYLHIHLPRWENPLKLCQCTRPTPSITV